MALTYADIDVDVDVDVDVVAFIVSHASLRVCVVRVSSFI